jgi:hypothetical protein
MPMIATTIMSSMSVKPFAAFFMCPPWYVSVGKCACRRVRAPAVEDGARFSMTEASSTRGAMRLAGATLRKEEWRRRAHLTRFGRRVPVD